ncbi:hypothetical protein L2E82_01026 [Cichorium intybus]|uniref:Uncharacterized protein n=1 Tax=Cichorium intybus TaxID=13427 RepID=A0ACB9GYX0_CICIN|nr:hypothetical protein L2E82_01026 [Cichorium intybus]
MKHFIMICCSSIPIPLSHSSSPPPISSNETSDSCDGFFKTAKVEDAYTNFLPQNTTLDLLEDSNQLVIRVYKGIESLFPAFFINHHSDV